MAFILVIALAAGCGQEDATGAAPQPIEATDDDKPEESGPSIDTAPPELAGELDAEVLGWGRVRFSWVGATDDQTPRHLIRYTLIGRRVPAENPTGESPLELEADAGTVDFTATIPVTHTNWRIAAEDEAGNRNLSTRVTQLVARPQPLDLLSGAVDGELVACFDEASRLICVGQSGRYTTWDGLSWLEGHAQPGVRMHAARGPAETVEVWTGRSRSEISAGGASGDERSAPPLQPLATEFDGVPAEPMRHLTLEPSGLMLWLDSAGQLWGSDGGPFSHLDDPSLLGSEGDCHTLLDLAFGHGNGFMRCANGNQLVLRTERHGYRWMVLPDQEGLTAAPVPQRAYLFGDGREITVLTWDGQVLRYDLGGWRLLADRSTTGADPTAIAWRDAGRREVLVAIEPDIIVLDQMQLQAQIGEEQRLGSLPTSHAVVYLSPPGENRVAVTSIGEVYRLDLGSDAPHDPTDSEPPPLVGPPDLALRAMPPRDLSMRVERSGRVAGVLARWPELAFVEVGDGHWSTHALAPLPADGPTDVDWLAAEVLDDGTILLAGDAGELGGVIGRSTVAGVSFDPFLAPPEEDAVPALPVPIESPVAPVRAIGSLGETRVAVGDGGSIWRGSEQGWLAVPSGAVSPLLSVRVFGIDRYVAGGPSGLLIECDLDVCELQMLDVGDVVHIVQVGEALVALGTEGVARRGPDRSWARHELVFEPPHPTGQPPHHLLSYEAAGGTHWALGDDGSVWRGDGNRFHAMGLVEDASDLWVQDDGGAIVMTGRALYRFDSD